MATKAKRASLTRKLRNKGIPIPKEASVEDLEHRLSHWEEGFGYLFRVAKPYMSKHKYRQYLEAGNTYWIPNSEFAREVFRSRLCFFLGRADSPPKDCYVLDIPKIDKEE
tara:strand:- start:8957 stop:9286 length:330 start_codon:yes stop_codon:yes gene_type:complete